MGTARWRVVQLGERLHGRRRPIRDDARGALERNSMDAWTGPRAAGRHLWLGVPGSVVHDWDRLQRCRLLRGRWRMAAPSALPWPSGGTGRPGRHTVEEILTAVGGIVHVHGRVHCCRRCRRRDARRALCLIAMPLPDRLIYRCACPDRRPSGARRTSSRTISAR